MFLPEIPDFELPFKKTFKCPVCKNDIAAKAIESNFSCPNCLKKINSNIENSWREGAITGTLMYVIMAVILYLLDDERFFVLNFLVYGFGGILSFYFGHLVYRHKTKLWAVK